VATAYTCPASTRTFIKDINVCNTTGGAVTVNVHLVPSGGTADTTNALVYGYSIGATSYWQRTGSQIMNAGDTIQVKASATGTTITISGGEGV
jgi:hypothetical protein